MSSVVHLARRFWGSLSRAEPVATDVEWVGSQCTAGEFELWRSMAVQDRRHSIVVARRFVEFAPTATRAEVAGALLHDVGKQVAGLGTLARVAATVVGPRGERFRQYHDHEALGAAMLAERGSDASTIELVLGGGALRDALRRADDV